MDYKHRVPGNRRRRLRRSDHTGLVVGVMVGAAVLGVGIWLWSSDDESDASVPTASTVTQLPAPSPTLSGESNAKDPAASPARREAQPPAPTPPEPRFTFYKILPEKEVIVAESEIKTIKREETQGKPLGANIYMIQAGSFTRLEDAERLKTRLSQLKVKTKIESVKIEKVNWHRVKIGPFDSLVNADRVRAYLRANQIDSVVQKATGR